MKSYSVKYPIGTTQNSQDPQSKEIVNNCLDQGISKET